jgi:hypothetical protein
MIFFTPGRRRRLGRLRRIRASCRALVSSALSCFGRPQLLLRWNDSCCLTAGTVQLALLTDSLVQCLTMAIKFILKIKLSFDKLILNCCLIENVFFSSWNFQALGDVPVHYHCDESLVLIPWHTLKDSDFHSSQHSTSFLIDKKALLCKPMYDSVT